MANRAKQQIGSGQFVQFPPEADGDFDVVDLTTITVWREKLNDRFDLGKGRLVVLEGPEAVR